MEIPSQTKIRDKQITCPRCSFYIKIPIIQNYDLGITEPITEQSQLSKIIISQNKEYDNLVNNISSLHQRGENLYRRCQKYHKILDEWAMFHGDNQLLEILKQINRGEFDKE